MNNIILYDPMKKDSNQVDMFITNARIPYKGNIFIFNFIGYFITEQNNLLVNVISDSLDKYGTLFYTQENFHLQRINKNSNYVVEIRIPTTANVYYDQHYHTRRTTKYIIEKIIPIEEHELCTDIMLINMSKRCGCAFRYIKTQTLELCLEAVKKNSDILQYIKKQTPEICLEAVKHSGLALKYVDNQTPEICLEAVKNYIGAIQFIKIRFDGYYEMCKDVLMHENGWIYFDDMIIKTPKLEKLAVQKSWSNLKYVENQTNEICNIALSQSIRAIDYVKNIDVLNEILTQNPFNIKYIKNQIEELCLFAVKQNGLALRYISPVFRTPKICLEAVKNNVRAFKYVKQQTEEICLEAVKKYPWFIRYVKNKTDNVIREAVKQNEYILKII